MALNLGQAFIQITPTTKGMQKDITSALKGLGRVGESAGKDIGSGMSKSVKGAGKKMAANVGLELDGEADKAGKSFGTKFSSSLGAIGFGGIAGVAMQAAQVLTGGLSSITAEAIAASDATDKFKQTLDFAGLDTSAIEKATKDAQVYADRTVYELGDIQNMTAQLAANGIKDYTALGEAAGNLNAVAGGNADTFKSVGMVMTQTAGAGKLTTENWNQLSDAIPGASGRIQDALREAGAFTGNFRDEMAKGEITAEEFNEAVLKIGSEPIAVEAAQSTATFEGMIGNLQAALSGSLANAFTTLKPHIETVVSGLTKAAETVLPLLVDGLDKAIGGLSSFGDLLQANKDWVEPLAAAIAGAAGAVGLWNGAIKLWGTATKIATGVQVAFNAVMSANPIMLAVTAIAALAAGLVWFFTKTETGQKIWSSLVDAMKSAWSWIKDTFVAGWQWLGDTISGVWQKIQSGWETVQGVFDTLKAAWGEVKAVFTGGDDGYGALSSLFGDEGALKILSVVDTIREKFLALKDFFGGIFDAFSAVFQAGWDNLKTVFAAAWLTIKAIFTGDWEKIPVIFSAAWDKIKETTSGALDVVKELISGWVDNIKTKVSQMWDSVKTAFTDGVSAVVDWVKQLPGLIGQWFSEMATKALSVATDMWNQTTAAFSDGVAKATDWVKQLPGRIKDTFLDAGTWLVSAGRSIITGLWDGMKQIWTNIKNWLSNRAADIRGIFSSTNNAASTQLAISNANGSIMAFADGGARLPRNAKIQRPVGSKGLVQWAEPETGGEAFIPLAASKRKRSTTILATVAGMFGMSLVGRDGQQYTPGLARQLAPTRVAAFADGGIVSARELLEFAAGKSVGGKQAPRSLEGAPYVWAGGLLSNWGDCSGAMSGLAAFATGVSLAGRKFATGDEGQWLSSNGFKAGTSPGKNAFEIGYFNGGPYGGHTSGTVYDASGKATNVEMGGGRGNGQIGGQAAGARHSQYTDRYWTPLSGIGSGASIESTSVDGITVNDSGKTQDVGWGTANGLFELAKKGLLKVYDTGGLLRHGQLAMNLSGRPEHVMTSSQWDKLVAGLTDLADAVRKGNMSYKWLSDRFGERAGSLAMEATGGALGGWTAETKLLQDAEKGLAEVRKKATSESEAVKKAEENLKKVKDKNDIDLKMAREKHGSDQKKMAAAQQKATDSVRKAELQLEKARKDATGTTSAYAKELAAAEQAVEAARKASMSKGFNAGANLQSLASAGSLADFVSVGDKLAGLGEKMGTYGKGLSLVTDAAGSVLSTVGSVKAAYEEQAEANAALVGAEADLKAARAEGNVAEIAEAENTLGKARKNAASMAAAAGHAEIAAVIGVAGTVVDVIKGVWDFAMKIRDRLWQAWIDSFEAQGTSFGLIGQWQQTLQEQQRVLTNLMIDHQLAAIEAKEAQRQLRIAAWGTRIAEAAGISHVASAAEKLWEYEAQQRRIQLSGYNDLSLAYDRFRWNAMEAAKDSDAAISKTREWKALAFDVYKANAEADEKRLAAQKAQVEAFKNATETQLKMQRITEDIQRQQELIAGMLHQAGMSQRTALIGQEIARVNKELAEMEEWYNRPGNRVRNLGGDIFRMGSKWDKAYDAYWEKHKQLSDYLTKLAGKEGAPADTAQLEAWRKLNEQLARSGSDAAKYIAGPGTTPELALGSFKLDKALSDLETERIGQERKLQDLKLTQHFAKAIAPLSEKMEGFANLANAFDVFAQAERTDNEKLRGALLKEGQVRLAASEALRTTPVEVSNPFNIELPPMPDPAPVTLVGNSFDSDEVARLLNQLGHDVNQLKDQRPSAGAVLAAKRTIR
ncbi:tape measure protein [Corynebacterium renale]|uniref:tape measure protein n=1 Tax=Corynebacterium renale TaxID=1724 RepID=UPI000E000FFC|nr:tape measure protein [Corynebacterium renale]STC97522.1 laminin subunit gamma-1 [Corynebacterium renale]